MFLRFVRWEIVAFVSTSKLSWDLNLLLTAQLDALIIPCMHACFWHLLGYTATHIFVCCAPHPHCTQPLDRDGTRPRRQLERDQSHGLQQRPNLLSAIVFVVVHKQTSQTPNRKSYDHNPNWTENIAKFTENLIVEKLTCQEKKVDWGAEYW